MNRDFWRFWAADGVSLAGTYLTLLALNVLAEGPLRASAFELGLLNAARWLPYLLFGLVAGVLVDRWRRRPVLIGADLARAVVLGLIPLLWALGLLTMPVLIALVALVGTFSLFHDAAAQSFVPRLVPPEQLTAANARLMQSHSAAQGLGPLIGGWLVKVIGAPLAILADAVSYLVSALMLTTLRTPEQLRRGESRDLRRELREGLRWVYRHPTLAPLAINTHAWFLFHGMVTTVTTFFVLRELGFDALALGMTLAVGGAGAVLGASLSERVVRRLGAGPTIVLGRWVTPAAYALIPFASSGTSGLVLLCASQFLFGLSIGTDSPIEMAYRQQVTPDRLLGRTNGTMRSVNRGMVVIGAPLGGFLADLAGNRIALWAGVAGLTVQAVTITLSRVRHASVRQETPAGA